MKQFILLMLHTHLCGNTNKLTLQCHLLQSGIKRNDSGTNKAHK